MGSKNILTAGKWLFLAGIALLIIRSNSYPWPLKRASDILFLLAALLACSSFVREKPWKVGRIRQGIFGFLLIFGGILIATAFAYFLNGTKVTAAGVLAFGRFIEVAVIFLLAGFFLKQDPRFLKEAALAQLSTLIYLIALIYPALAPEGRFRLFENWPSNAGYYLIASLSMIYTWLAIRASGPARSALYFALFAGLGGILLWTMSRASWLAVLLSIGLIIFTRLFVPGEQRRSKIKKAAVGLFTALLGIGFGFLLLSAPVKNQVLTRFFPQLQLDIWAQAPAATIKNILETDLMPDLSDPNRIIIWKKYISLLLKNPLGLGLDYPPVTLGDESKGPHNTLLELLLVAGPFGLAGFLYLFLVAVKNAATQARRSGYGAVWPIYLLAVLAGFATAAFFDNMSTFRLMWILIGVGFFLDAENQNKELAGKSAVLD